MVHQPHGVLRPGLLAVDLGLDDLEDVLALEADLGLGLLHRVLVGLAHEADLGGPVRAQLLADELGQGRCGPLRLIPPISYFYWTAYPLTRYSNSLLGL